MELSHWRQRVRTFSFEGQPVAYWREGAGRPLILIHGFPTSAWDWVPIWPALTAARDVIACDMLGFGMSAKPRSGHSLHRQADLHEALLKELGIQDFDLLVHDYGTSVGQELLARQQEGAGCQGLGQVIFLNGGIFPGEHRPRPIQRLGASPLGFIVSLAMNRQRFGKSFAQVFGPDTQPSKEELDIFWELIAENDGHRITHKLLGYMHDRMEHKDRWVSVLGQVQDRIGLINGALDPVPGEHVFKVWQDQLPQARAHLLPHVGHYPQVEAPKDVATKALEWLGA